jgi:hypothetical protein
VVAARQLDILAVLVPDILAVLVQVEALAAVTHKSSITAVEHLRVVVIWFGTTAMAD